MTPILNGDGAPWRDPATGEWSDMWRNHQARLCRKQPHTDPRGGYLHAEDDDRPYDVDGVQYCGRCHEALA